MSAAASNVDNQKESYGLSAIWQQLETVRYTSRFTRFAQLFIETIKGVFLNPVSTLFSLISIGSALFVLGLFLLIFQNVGELTTSSVQQLSVSVYLKDRLIEGDIDALTKLIEERPGVAKVTFLSKTEALTLFSSALQEVDQSFLAGLEENPLPASLEIELQPEISRAALSQLVNELKDLPGILHVGYATEVFDRAREFVSFVKLSGGAVVLIMLLVTAFVIASTIRMMLLEREGELAIMRLVGATSFLIRFPCILEGALFGLIGGLAALLFLSLFFQGLLASTSSVVDIFPVLSNLQFLNFKGIAIVLLVGTGIGVLASYVAARRI